MIQVRKTSGGEVRYRVRVHFAGRIVATRTFRRKGDAQAWERDQLRRLERGQGLLDTVAGRKPVEWWCRQYLAAWSGGAPASYTRLESLLRSHVVPEFGKVPASAVTRASVRTWVSRLTSERSPSTARLALGALRGVLRFAVEAEALEVNVAQGVSVHGERPGEVRALSHQEVHDLAGAVLSKRDRAFVYFVAYCGLRFGEATALTWRDFSVSNGHLSVSVTKAVRQGKSGREIGPTKTLSTRVVPVPDVVRQALVELWVEKFGSQGAESAFWPEGAMDESAIVFATRTGGPMALSSTHTFLRKACERAGIEPAVGPHNLRDTYASLAISSRASVSAVAANMGHSMTMTLRHYAAFIPQERSQVALRLDQAAAYAAGSVACSDTHTTDIPEDSGG